MIGLRRPSAKSLVLICAAALTLAACGHSGSSSADLPKKPGEIVPAVEGTVMAPNGELAAADGYWWSWPLALQLVSRANAALSDDLMPIQSIVFVSLSRVRNEDAVHGSTQHSLPLVTDARTDENGEFKITHRELSDIEDNCRLMVQVGSDDPLNPDRKLLTRAFVLTHAGNNIDAVTEAVVRVVLDRLQSSSAQLCDFTVKDLLDISAKARNAAFTATGSTVPELNANVYSLVANNPRVKAALDAIAPQ